MQDTESTLSTSDFLIMFQVNTKHSKLHKVKIPHLVGVTMMHKEASTRNCFSLNQPMDDGEKEGSSLARGSLHISVKDRLLPEFF